MLDHSPIERRSRETKVAGGMADVVAVPFQGRLDDRAFGTGEVEVRRASRARGP
jgi:hypothetical protein